ncbi:MAG: ATP-grasp domain-containing protein [Bacteroidota bacterium]
MTTFLVLASYEKGFDFIRECHDQGVRVVFLTLEKLRDRPWPHEAIAETFYAPDFDTERHVLNTVAYLARERKFDRIIPLDEFDAEVAAALREHLRIPGMGETTVRYFRDKLAMRFQAREAGVRVPDFVPVTNYDDIRAFFERQAPPYILKPRGEASALGIRKIHDQEQLWRALDELGDEQSFFLLEQFVAGDVFHVDSVVANKKLQFAEVSGYLSPPLDVMHGGGLFASRTLDRDSAEAKTLNDLTQQLVEGLGIVRGAMHTEFIRSAADGEFYFLETAARVGGANLSDMVEAASGVNLWREWAKIEIADARGERYRKPKPRTDHAGILVTLARQTHPDLSGYDDPEIVWRMPKKQHAGLIVRADTPQRVRALLDGYMPRFYHDFHAAATPPDSARDVE